MYRFEKPHIFEQGGVLEAFSSDSKARQIRENHAEVEGKLIVTILSNIDINDCK